MGYWETVKPTYIENWEPALYSLSMAHVDVPLSLEEAEALGGNIVELYELFPEPHIRDISEIVRRLDAATDKFPKGCFVRLGSRSPKDSFVGMKRGFKVQNGREAIELLTGISERMSDDLLLAIKEKYPPHIFVREWIDIPEWSEFRCFMDKRRLVGISQYNYLQGAVYPEIEALHDQIEWAIKMFFDTQFKSACSLPSVIFDVSVTCKGDSLERMWSVKLIEINPFFEHTDPCLFYGHKGFDGSFKFARK